MAANGAASTSATVTGFMGKEEPEVTTVCGRLTEKTAKTDDDDGSYTGGYKDGEATKAEFCFPNGLALGKDKSLYVSDSDNRRIRKVDLKTGHVTTFVGGGGTGFLDNRSYPFADAHGEHAMFGEVRGITFDAKDNLYVADMFHYRVRKVTPEADVTTFAGQPKAAPKPGADPEKPGADDQYEDGAAIGQARFNRPSAVAADKQGNVYVCDFSNHRIRKVSPDGQVTTFAGSGERGCKDGAAKEASFHLPNHICIDKRGNLYVAEAENFRIRKITPSGHVTTYAGCGEQGFQDGPAATAKFDGCNAVACDTDGFVYVTEDENHRIRMISPNGVVRTLAGNGDRGETNGPTALTSSFAMPTGLCVDPETGHLYVCDYANHLIRKVHQRVVAAAKTAMLKETDGRFPPMPAIAEEDDKEESTADPASTNSAPGGTASAAGSQAAEAEEGADDQAKGGKKDKKKSKSKKREKSEMSEEGKMNGDAKSEESANGSDASRKSSASGAGAEGAKKEGEDDDADNKSCRMCQSKSGCSIM